MFRRKIESQIISYFNDNTAPIMVIEGARQIGKTYIINKLGKEHYSNYLEINFAEDKQGPEYFKNVRTTDDFYLYVESKFKKRLGNYDDTLVFLDEIQEYPQFLTLLKFFRQEQRFKFIASGSMLGIALMQTTSIPIGSIEITHMFPMDFEEFLWADGVSPESISTVSKKVAAREEIPDGVHKVFLKEFREYLICGGLPYCVGKYLNNRDIIGLRESQSAIFELYGNDASKYDLENKLHTKAILQQVSSTVENKKKRIRLKDIEGRLHSKFTEYQEDFDTLIGSGVVLEVKCCTDPVFPLRQTVKNSMLKLYLNDVGLLSNLLFSYNIKPILEDIPQVNLGNLYETAAAVILATKNKELYYSDSKRTGEVDFLIDDYGNLNVKALEIKSGRDFRIHSALDKLMSSANPPSEGIVFSNDRRIQKVNGVTYLPIYAIMFI